MRVITPEQLPSVLATLPKNPRIIASGNFATPHTLLQAADKNLESFVLHMLNAHPGIPDRDGITYESAFVGPAMRRHPPNTYLELRSLATILGEQQLGIELPMQPFAQLHLQSRLEFLWQ